MSTSPFVTALCQKEGQQITQSTGRMRETTGKHERYWELVMGRGLDWFIRPAGSLNTICVITVTTRRGRRIVRTAGFNKEDEVQEMHYILLRMVVGLAFKTTHLHTKARDHTHMQDYSGIGWWLNIPQNKQTLTLLHLSLLF